MMTSLKLFSSYSKKQCVKCITYSCRKITIYKYNVFFTDAVTADGETLFRCGTPSIVYADESFAGHTPSRLAGLDMPSRKDERFPDTPKSKLKKFKELSAKKLKR